MAYDNNGGGFAPRTMHQGNWSCSGCGAAIHELPFQPDQERLGQLLCRDCHKAERGDGDRGGDRNNNDRGPRTMHQGNWSCSGCGAAIRELPFQPDQERLGQLLCRDCHKQKRGMM